MSVVRNLLGASVVAIAAMSGSAHAVPLVINGGFEVGAYPGGSYSTLGTGSTAITGWVVSTGTVDWIDTYWDGSGPGADRSIDLSGASLGVISQTITGLVSGQSYTLSFDIARNKDLNNTQSLVASLGALGLGSWTATTDASIWTTISTTFTWVGGTSAVLAFTATSSPGCCYGPALDSVSLSAVPVPAAAVLLGSGLLGLAAFGRRRRNA